MTGRSKLENILRGEEAALHVAPGRLMSEMMEGSPGGAGDLFRFLVRTQGRDAALHTLDLAGIRGRGGGGFPTAHKLWLVASAESAEKFFICNANSMQPGSAKESWFIRANPGKVVEAVAMAAYCAGARTGFIALPQRATSEANALEEALQFAREHWIPGSGWDIDLKLIRTPDAYLAGEETALLEWMEGRALQPRGKPPLPTNVGLHGRPTAISNLETVLQCRYALIVGSDAYRETGASYAPGTAVFTLHGRVNRPGIYELPLGTRLRDLIHRCGNGLERGMLLKAVLPGGIGSAALGSECLDTPLDFDSLRDAGSDLGSGVVFVLGQEDCAVETAIHLARFFHQASCGKCQPCKDGTARTLTMLTRLDAIEQPSVDVPERVLPPSKRPGAQLIVLNNSSAPGGVSYTDTVKGLDKISHLCEFFRYRGDCHHSTEAANAVLSLLSLFREEFEQHRQNGTCELSATSNQEATATVNLG